MSDLWLNDTEVLFCALMLILAALVSIRNKLASILHVLQGRRVDD